MDFGSWSPSHTILVLVVFVTFIGQVAVYFYRTTQNDKKIDKQAETFFHALERLEDRMDKRLSDMQSETNHRFVEMNQRFTEMNQRLSDMQADTNQRFTEMNQRLSDMQADTNQRFTEMNQRLSDVEAILRQLNQNHIEHLNQHHSGPVG